MAARHKQLGHFWVALGSQKIVKSNQDGPTGSFSMRQVCVERFYVNLTIVARDDGDDGELFFQTDALPLVPCRT